MPWYLEAWRWAEDHPYVSVGVAAGALVGGYLFLHRSTAPSPLAGLSPTQAYRLQSQQIAASSPLAIAQAQARAATAEANAGARASIAPATASAASATAIARAQAVSNNLLARLGLKSSLATTASDQTLGLANISATTQSNTIAAKLQAILAQIGLAESTQQQEAAQEIALAQAGESGYAAELSANAGTLGFSNDELNINPPMFSPIQFGGNQSSFSPSQLVALL